MPGDSSGLLKSGFVQMNPHIPDPQGGKKERNIKRIRKEINFLLIQIRREQIMKESMEISSHSSSLTSLLI
jgi:hypothetical protein